MPEKTDLELVEDFRVGRNEAFNELVRRYRERVYWIARRMTGRHEDADDVVQEVFVRVYQNLKKFRADASFYTWLYRIATNVSLNSVRKKRVREFVDFDEMDESLDSGSAYADAAVLKKEFDAILQRAIEKLPPKQKMVFILRFNEEMSFEQMAQSLGKSVGGLKANYFHAVQKIQKYVRSEMNK
jgi:RNA polymerase sigma-70 factor (ECF subfamily)